MAPVLKFQLPCYIFIVCRLFSHYSNSMHTLLTLLVLGLLPLPGSPFNIGVSIQVRPSCKTVEECYEKYIRFDLRPLREGKGRPYKRACSEHEACKCTLLPVSLCAHEVYENFRNKSLRVEDCPTSLQCHYLRFNNCEKDSVCPFSIKFI